MEFACNNCRKKAPWKFGWSWIGTLDMAYNQADKLLFACCRECRSELIKHQFSTTNPDSFEL